MSPQDKETVDGAAVGLHEADLVDAFKMKAQVDDDQQTMGPDLDDASFLLQFTEVRKCSKNVEVQDSHATHSVSV